MSGLFVAFGKRWGELRIESGTTPLTLACYKGDVGAISATLDVPTLPVNDLQKYWPHDQGGGAPIGGA